MEHSGKTLNPIVSVIIPCYNHGRYLAEAIESVLLQKYPGTEIIVVDDGSVDNTKQVCENFPGIHYVYQVNQGLSAARNIGIERSKGDFLIFLDADDWLLENAIITNVDYLLADRDLAFVSGAYIKVIQARQKTELKQVLVDDNHYLHFLEGNYIAMHATVMYRRWCFDRIRFDTTLKACEDYDVYLHVSRQFKVHHHQHPIAAYRFHDENMSGNFQLMINTALAALEKQEPFLKTIEEKEALKSGRKKWINFYSGQLYIKLLNQLHHGAELNAGDIKLLKQINRRLHLKLLIKNFLHVG